MTISLSHRSRTILAVVVGVALMVGVAALAFLMPDSSPAQSHPSRPPSQVIYRFDDHRWLELKGWDCEGALWYFDSNRGIRTEVSPQFFRISTFTYIHPSERYIAIPYRDLSAFLVSRDGGRTFNDAYPIVSDRGRYNGQRPTADEVSRFVVFSDRGFLETKGGRLLESSKPFGERWGLDYIDYLAPGEKPTLTTYARPNFQNMAHAIPQIEGYKGWTHMRCDPSAGEGAGQAASR